MPNKTEILQYLSLLSEFWPTVKGAFRRRTPAEKLQRKLDELDKEEGKYRDRLSLPQDHRKKLDWATYERLMKEVDRKRQELLNREVRPS